MPARRGQARAVRNKSCPERRLAQSQSATRETRMQTYRAASASGGFANIDLNPRRPTTNRTAQDHQREKQITHKGSHQDASQINIPWCAHWISLKQVFCALGVGAEDRGPTVDITCRHFQIASNSSRHTWLKSRKGSKLSLSIRCCTSTNERLGSEYVKTIVFTTADA
jgi:hypothetical protein